MNAGRFGLPALGLAAPIGIGKGAVARALFAGSSGLLPRETVLAGRGLYSGPVTEPLPSVPPDLAGHDTRNNRLMMAALAEIRDDIETARQRFGAHRVAVIMGTSTSGIAEGEAAYASVLGTGSWPGAFHYRQQEIGNLSEFAARLLGLDGPAYTVATACSSSGKVFATARRLIRAGFADAAVAGGADTLCRTTIGGFSALEAVSPERTNPFSANRRGINIGEAAAVFLVTADTAPVELAGIGESSDAHHISAPDPEGKGATAAMRAALDDAGLAPPDIAYVNLHGTGTALNDGMEGKAVQALFGAATPCGSTKGLTGHTLGAAGALEAAFLWLVLHPEWNPDGRLPPHCWDGVADPAIPPLALNTSDARLPDPRGKAAMLSNSFAFGGSNVALILSRGALA